MGVVTVEPKVTSGVAVLAVLVVTVGFAAAPGYRSVGAEGGVYMTEPELPPKIKEIVDLLTQRQGSPEGPKAELDARVAVLVASEVARATTSVTTNLIELTSRVGQLSKVIENSTASLTNTIGQGAGALNETTAAGNKLNQRIGLLTLVTVVLTVVQIVIALRGH